VTVDRAAFLEEVMWRGAIHEPAEAEAAIRATLEAVSEQLAPEDAAALARALPSLAAPAPARRDPSSAQLLADLHARIAASEGVSLGRAVEQVRAVCLTVADALELEQRLLLERRLPADWAQLFALETRAPPADAPRGTPPGRGHTLATGRPGSQHPLAEGYPPRAQSDSVVTSENPHADTKLSSAAVSTDEEALATGRPGATDSIAEAKDERPRRR
jgi:uncharacterized protein (DUF2267 family)